MDEGNKTKVDVVVNTGLLQTTKNARIVVVVLKVYYRLKMLCNTGNGMAMRYAFSI